MKNTLIKYVKRRGKPVGCLVATLNEQDQIQIAFSLCRKTDKYDKELGRKIALERLSKQQHFLPISLTSDMLDFASRCKRYFKEKGIKTKFLLSYMSKEERESTPWEDLRITSRGDFQTPALIIDVIEKI